MKVDGGGVCAPPSLTTSFILKADEVKRKLNASRSFDLFAALVNFEKDKFG